MDDSGRKNDDIGSGLNRPPATKTGKGIAGGAVWLTNLDIRAHHVTGVGGGLLLASSAIIGSIAVVENNSTFAITSTVIVLAGLLCFTALISGHIESLSYNLRTAEYLEKHKVGQKSAEVADDDWVNGGVNGKYRYRPEVRDVLRSSGFGFYCLLMGVGAYAALHYGIMAAGLSVMESGVSSFFLGFAMGTLMGSLASLYIANQLDKKDWVNYKAQNRTVNDGIKFIGYKWNNTSHAYEPSVVVGGTVPHLLARDDTNSFYYRDDFIKAATFTGGIMTGLVMSGSTVLVSSLTPLMQEALGAGTLVNCISLLMIAVPAVVVCPVMHRVVDDIIHAGHELEIKMTAPPARV